MQDIRGTSAEFLEVANSNDEARAFLLGYISSELPPPVIRSAILAWLSHKEQLAAYGFVLNEGLKRFERKFD